MSSIKEPDRISEVFKNTTIFITGASGFFGKLLIEKLLRCTEVKKIYLLVREKKGKYPEQRLEDMFNNLCFSVLKKEKPDAFKKCAVISGDVAQPDLGMSSEDRQNLVREVDYIFHSAATTRFDDTMKYAVTVNTRGTKFALEFAKECKRLKLFIHVSTSYAFPNQNILYERFYEPPADPDAVIQSMEWIKEDSRGIITKQLLGDVPNTYTFSKALAEELVRREVGKIPLIVVRPALMLPCFQEPLPGWFNNMQGPIGIFAGAGKGIIRTMRLDTKSYANMIPADAAINGTLVAAWDFFNSSGKQIIFNLCVPEQDIKITWDEVIELGKDIINTDAPFNQILWYPGGTPTKSKLVFHIYFLLFQIIPALVVDALVMCLGYKRFLFDINLRIYKGQEMFDYYANRAWDFDLSYCLKLRKKMNAVEKVKYKIDSDGVEIRKYIIDCVMYARRHVFNEPDEWLPAAKRKLKILFVADRILKILFFVVLFNYLYKWILIPIFGSKQI